MCRTGAIRCASLSRRTPARAWRVAPSRPAMPCMNAAILLGPALGPTSSAFSSRDSIQTLLRRQDQADQEQGEDQLADMGVVGGQDLRDPALEPGRGQQGEAGQVDQGEAQQEEEAVAVEPGTGGPGGDRSEAAPGCQAGKGVGCQCAHERSIRHCRLDGRLAPGRAGGDGRCRRIGEPPPAPPPRNRPADAKSTSTHATDSKIATSRSLCSAQSATIAAFRRWSRSIC